MGSGLGLGPVLVSDGCDVVGEAADGSNALLAMSDLQPDLALIDIQLPDIDGFEVAKLLSVEGGCPAIVLISRLVTAVVVEAHDEWAVAERRYLSEESMDKLNVPVKEEAPLAISA
jgi:DNA-binding NarL/FixJ family response regulator